MHGRQDPASQNHFVPETMPIGHIKSSEHGPFVVDIFLELSRSVHTPEVKSSSILLPIEKGTAVGAELLFHEDDVSLKPPPIRVSLLLVYNAAKKLVGAVGVRRSDLPSTIPLLRTHLASDWLGAHCHQSPVEG